MNFSQDERQWLESLYLKHRLKMYNVAFSILNNVTDAEDAVSDAFLSIASSLDKCPAVESGYCEAYCLIAVKNKCMDILRKNKKQKTEPLSSQGERIDETAQLSDFSLKAVDNVVLRQKIKALSYTDQEILYLYYFIGLDLKECSKLLCISENASSKRLQYARATSKNQSEMIFMKDDYRILSQAVSETFCQQFNPQEDEFSTPHEFSDRFEKKMNKLIKPRYKYPVAKLTLRLALMILFIATCMCAIYVGADKSNGDFDGIIVKEEKCTDGTISYQIGYMEKDDPNAPTSEERNRFIQSPEFTLKKPTYIPPEYKSVRDDDTTTVGFDAGWEYSYFDENDESKSFQKTIDFQQVPFQAGLMTCGYGKELNPSAEIIEINGYKAVILFMDKTAHFLLWRDDDYIYTIQSNALTKDEIIAIAKSVQ